MNTTVELVRSFVDEMLKAGGGTVNSHQIAVAELHRRALLDETSHPDQVRDYVQFVLREMPNVCRHSIGNGCYVVHIETECSDFCKEKYARWSKWLGREIKRCGRCNLELPISVECGLCG